MLLTHTKSLTRAVRCESDFARNQQTDRQSDASSIHTKHFLLLWKQDSFSISQRRLLFSSHSELVLLLLQIHDDVLSDFFVMQQHDMRNIIDDVQTRMQISWRLIHDVLILSAVGTTTKSQSVREFNILLKFDVTQQHENKEFASVPTMVQRDSILVNSRTHCDKVVSDSSIERDKHRTFIWSVLKLKLWHSFFLSSAHHESEQDCHSPFSNVTWSESLIVIAIIRQESQRTHLIIAVENQEPVDVNLTTRHISFRYQCERWSRAMSWHRWSMTTRKQFVGEQQFDRNLFLVKSWHRKTDRWTIQKSLKNYQLASSRNLTDDNSPAQWICKKVVSVKECRSSKSR